jgi:hypothetical protein
LAFSKSDLVEFIGVSSWNLLVLEKKPKFDWEISLFKMKFYKQLSNLHLLKNLIESSSFIDDGLPKDYLGLGKDLSRGYQGVAKKSL